MKLQMRKRKSTRLNSLIKICCLTGALVAYSACSYAALSNNTLPSGGSWVGSNGSINQSGNIMNIIQQQQNAVIKWNDFSIGANATVNFSKENGGNFNILNYVNSGKVSKIYGTMNAKDGNVFLVNTAGTVIGKSAQINVGSLYVSNKEMNDNQLNTFAQNATINGTTTGAQMMSLGNIMANKITFDGDRIVLDTERVQTYAGGKLDPKDIVINTKNKDDVVLGYDAYDKTNGYKGKNDGTVLATVNGDAFTKADGYMWVKDAVQLQAIDTNLSGKYALHNSIDATATDKWYGDKGFKPIGVDQNGNVIKDKDKNGFTGKFDGLDNSIFGLTINRDDKNNVGLFGVVHNATIKNVTLTGGNITGAMNVGSVIGSALGTTTVDNVLNSINVTGGKNAGGIVGFVGDYKENGNIIVNADGNFQNLINTGIVNSTGDQYNPQDPKASNAGGLIGFMENSKLGGNSYNLGSVTGEMNNVGGLVGYAENSTIGNDDSKDGILNNQLNVTGKYNVGGIVGNAENTKVQNVSNAGNIKATGSVEEDYKYFTDFIDYGGHKVITVKVDVANVGGIAGNASRATIDGVLNTGDVSSAISEGKDDKGENYKYYNAGNVGGVVGKAVDTNISDALNKENDIRGAHNVGGIAGYFGSSIEKSTSKDYDPNATRYTVSKAVNSGGDIMATGARHGGNIVTEHVRANNWGEEDINFGNMGGIVGMLDGDNTYITSSGNRGTVHSLDIADENNILPTSKAGNTGGIVGRIDRSKAIRDHLKMDNIKNDYLKAAVSNSYNTGDVSGFWGVGGVIGMMYNGEAAGVYNTGKVNTTVIASGLYPTVNMGGIVGSTAEDADGATTLIYDAYNTGRIGDPNYRHAGRHVGGIAGRLNGQIEKAYNTGDIYNGFNVVGGIVGWGYAGSIKNSFNTGNITVVDQDTSSEAGGSQVGGIAGGVYSNAGGFEIANVYNLGTLRSFKVAGSGRTSLGGILGAVINKDGNPNHHVVIKNAYTTGNLFSYDTKGNSPTNDGVQAIYGEDGRNNVISFYRPTLENVYYITPNNNVFANLENNAQGAKVIAYKDRYKAEAYQYEKDGKHYSLSFSTDNGSASGNVSDDGEWRIYGNSTPILNAFLPEAEKFFGNNDGNNKDHMDGIDKIQYGTAHNPFLTIINANKDLTYNWDELGSRDNASFAVYGGGLTINNFKTNGYFGGLLYADEALSVNAKGNSISLGSGSELFGSSVNINTDGKLTGYGVIVATGNGKDKADVSISADKGVDLYGEVVAAKKGQSFIISDIDQTVDETEFEKEENIKDQYWTMTTISRRFAHKTKDSTSSGDITISSSEGDVNLFYGNMEEGLISAGNDINVTADKGNVYIDSDVQMGGNLNLTAQGEALFDLSNVGRVNAKYFVDILVDAARGQASTGDSAVDNITNRVIAELGRRGLVNTNDPGAVAKMKQQISGAVKYYVEKNCDYSAAEHKFTVDKLNSFVDGLQISGSQSINMKAENAKLTVDLWDGEKFDLNRYDVNGSSFKDKVSNIALNVNGQDANSFDHTYIKIDSVEQLDAISKIGDDGLTYNYAVMGDIDASGYKDYSSIADNGGEFTGKFDGRGNRIIGLNAKNGLFGTIGADGKVTDVKIYSSSFTGETTGAIAAINKGTIDNVTGFGNTVEGSDAAGGLVGINTGTITNVTNAGIAKTTGKDATAGGIAGMNTASGSITNATSNSAVVSTVQSAGGLGGVVGSNAGNITNVESKGIIRGQFGYLDVDGKTIVEYSSNNIGGIAGANSGTIEEAYNKSVLSGADNVGGIAGSNTGTLKNVSNAGDITGVKYTDNKKGQAEYTGGLVGHNSGAITNGRNNGYIEGHSYVGGLVGYNAKDTVMQDLVNDSSATIIGEEFVGGIAGVNAGKITASDQEQLINRGKIYGQNYVGGVAGQNYGWIDNTNNNVTLFVKDESKPAQYFGGVVGKNEQGGTINKATNSANINAGSASYVGGVVGQNDGTLQEMSGNYGNVIGGSFVGGVAGKNNAKIEGVEAFNEGKVEGINGGAGGLFGHNVGAITGSTLVNNGVVVGKGDTGTGGIFGYNSGNISETTMVNTVKGKVFGVSNVGGLVGVNKGTITGGRDDDDNYYKYQIYNNGTVTGAGNNVGGLVGTNNGNGSITAAYNTGVVTGNTNVGGIAGVNTGTIDQVFNSVFENGVISGNSNVGAIVGDNNGEVANAYTTTGISGNTDKVLIGNGNTVGSTDDVWMTYGDGKNEGTNKLLSVFLTKLHFEKNDNFDKIIYNAGKQVVSIKEITGADGKITLQVAVGNTVIGTLTAVDNDADAAHSLQDYLNANTLLDPNENAQNAGEHLLFGTQQISSNANNHNNLGFDISSIKFAIKKATIDVLLNEISRVYGDANISNNGKYDFTYGSNVSEAMKNELANNVTMDVTSDGALVGGSSGKVTADANKDNENYLWNADIKINGDLANNYEVNVQAGKSFVTKADLTINAGDVNIQLGSKPNYTGTLDKLVNGDSFTGSFGITDSKLEGQVGTHDGVIGIVIDGKVYTVGTDDWTQNGFWKNYNITLNAGDLTVTAPVDPDKPGIEDWKFWEAEDKYAWGKKREERERKAEIHYVDGGMEI